MAEKPKYEYYVKFMDKNPHREIDCCGYVLKSHHITKVANIMALKNILKRPDVKQVDPQFLEDEQKILDEFWEKQEKIDENYTKRHEKSLKIQKENRDKMIATRKARNAELRDSVTRQSNQKKTEETPKQTEETPKEEPAKNKPGIVITQGATEKDKDAALAKMQEKLQEGKA